MSAKIETLRFVDFTLEEEAEMMYLLDEAPGGSTRQVLESLQKHRQNYLDYAESYETFQEGEHIIVLTKIFSQLPNLKRIELGEGEEIPKRLEDSSSIRIHGMSTVELDTGVSGVFRDDHSAYNDIHAILTALSISQNPIESLSARRRLDHIPYVDLNRAARLTYSYGNNISISLQHLRELELSIGLEPEMDDVKVGKALRKASWLADLVNLTPQLERLGLSFIGAEVSERGFHELVSRSFLPRLRYFELRNAVVSAKDLWHFLNLHRKSLDITSLRFVGLFRF